jgi:hypothetical protein
MTEESLVKSVGFGHPLFSFLPAEILEDLEGLV